MHNTTIIDTIKTDTRLLLDAFNKRNLAKLLKFYEILIDMQRNLLTKNKREIFYHSVNIFKTQSTIDRLIERMNVKFQISQEDLLIASSLKGIYAGPIKFIMKDGVVENSVLIPDMTRVVRIETGASITVVVEKDSFFSFVMQAIDDVPFLKSVIWVCGKGYPCRNTLRLLEILKRTTKVFGMFDYDPYGIHIFCVYKYGSARNKSYKVEGLERIGICADDVVSHKIDEKELIDLNASDYKMIEKLMGFEDVKGDLMFLKGLQKKMEIEIFAGRGKVFITEYLINKLKNV